MTCFEFCHGGGGRQASNPRRNLTPRAWLRSSQKSLGNRQTLNDRQVSLNVPPEEGIPYTRMAASKSTANNSNLTDSDRSNPGTRKSSLLGTLTSSFRSNKNPADSPAANNDKPGSNNV